jgi:hypothetical protein
MGGAQVCLVGAVLLLGVLAAPLPGLPGPLLCWAAVLWWATGTHSPLSWSVLALCTVLLVAARAVAAYAPRGPVTARAAALTAALSGALAALGAPLGYVAGVRGRGAYPGRTSPSATAASGAGVAVLAEAAGCLLVTAVWLAAVLLG